jgi:RNA polymerase sigma factor (sigma-70 family)
MLRQTGQMRNDIRSDTQLLEATRARDADAFGEFYLHHRAVVLAFFGRRVRNSELAADLLGETFAAALLVTLDPERELPREPIAWLLTIARNKLTDSARRGQVEQKARQRLAMEPLALDDDSLQRIEQLIDATDVAVTLASQLPAEQFQALSARILDEHPYSEIAHQLRCSEAVVRKRVSRALKTLRGAMEGLR